MTPLPMGDAEFRGLAHIAGRLDFFKSFKGAQLERVLSHVDLYAYDKGETIFHKGDPPNAFYLIYEGQVRIHLGYRFLGLIKTLVTLKAGDLFGEMALLEKRAHSGTASTLQTTKLFVIAYQDFDQLMASDPEFADLIKFIVTRRKHSKN